MERCREVGWYSHETAHRIGEAKTGSESRRLFLFWGGSLRRPLLRHTKTGECVEAAVPARLADEWTTASAGIWGASTAARREPAWLQDGQMDRAYRVHRVGEDAWQR